MHTSRILFSEWSCHARSYLRRHHSWQRFVQPRSNILRVTLNGIPRKTLLSTTTIPSPALEGEEKNYTPKIQKLVSEISQLTLVEVADLNELLKKSLRLPDAPTMSMSMMNAAMMGSAKAGAASQEDEGVEEKKVVKTLFTVRLTKYDETKKVALIKEIKTAVAGMNLVQAKKFVETVPQTVKTDVSKDEAEKLKAVLVAAGATIEIE